MAAPPHLPPRPPPKRPRVVVIAGATGTLGRAVAERLTARGDRVILLARDAGRLDALVAALPEGAARALAVDLSGVGAAARVSGACADATDLIFALGSFPTTAIERVSRDDLAAQMLEQCALFVELTLALRAQLSDGRGAAIAFGDDGVERPYRDHLAYLAGKGALTAAARALSLELSTSNDDERGMLVRVGVVAVGAVTDPNVGDGGGAGRALAARARVGRTGTPAEVAHVALSMMDATWASGEVWGVGR